MNSTPSFFDQLAQSYRTAFVDWSAPDLNATDMVFCVVVAIVWAYLTDKWETQHREDLLSRQPPLSPKQITREMRWSHMGKLGLLLIIGVTYVLWRSWP